MRSTEIIFKLSNSNFIDFVKIYWEYTGEDIYM